MKKPDICWCGRPVHYSDKRIQHQVEEIASRFGEFITVILDGGSRYAVQRHYIALHGIANKDIKALGFKEVN